VLQQTSVDVFDKTQNLINWIFFVIFPAAAVVNVTLIVILLVGNIKWICRNNINDLVKLYSIKVRKNVD